VYDQPESRNRSAEEMAPIIADVDVVNAKAIEDGIFVFAGGLHDPSAATTIDPRGATPTVSDGPYAESKEHIGGFWIVELPNLDAALDWAREAAVACRQPVEVRPFMAEPPNGGTVEEIADWQDTSA
jgi:hypothetical protein